MTRRLFFAASAMALMALVSGAPAVRAHAIVLESRPAADETVAGPDIDFLLRFNSRIDKQRSRLALVQPDGSTRPLEIEPGGEPDQLRASAAGLAPGDYLLQWQVLAVDGHITRGTIAFRVIAGAA